MFSRENKSCLVGFLRQYPKVPKEKEFSPQEAGRILREAIIHCMPAMIVPVCPVSPVRRAVPPQPMQGFGTSEMAGSSIGLWVIAGLILFFALK
jgi:hypothetical protein